MLQIKNYIAPTFTRKDYETNVFVADNVCAIFMQATGIACGNGRL